MIEKGIEKELFTISFNIIVIAIYESHKIE
jgi:hypothetical protein